MAVLKTPFLHYKLNDNAANTVVADTGFGQFNGVATHLTNTLSTPGKINTAFLFNGSTNYIDLSSFVSKVYNDNFGTTCMWIKTNAFSSFQTMFDVDDTSVADQYHHFALWEVGGLYYLTSTMVEPGASYGWTVRGKTPLSVGVWYHVAVTQDGTGPKLYVNGVEEEVVRYNWLKPNLWFSRYGSQLDAMFIATSRGNGIPPSWHFNGSIDDFRYYKYALRPEELQLIVAGGVGTEYEGAVGFTPQFYTPRQEPGITATTTANPLFAHLKMNENAASTTVVNDGKGGNVVANVNTDQLAITGKINGAFYFNGSEYLDCTSWLPSIINDTQGSFAFWVKPDAGYNDVSVFSIGGPGAAPGGSRLFRIWVYGQQRTAGYYMSDGTYPTAGFSNIQVSTYWNVLPVNEWFHVVITCDGNESKLYINGERFPWYWTDSSTSKGEWIAALDVAPTNCYIAAEHYLSYSRTHFHGALDDFRYYSGVAITPAMVKALWNQPPYDCCDPVPPGDGTEEENPRVEAGTPFVHYDFGRPPLVGGSFVPGVTTRDVFEGDRGLGMRDVGTYGCSARFIQTSVKLMLHSDRYGGATIYDDTDNWTEYNPPHPVPSNGTDAISGANSFNFNGSTQYLQYTDSPDWTIGGSDFTVSFWAKLAANVVHPVVNHHNTAGNQRGWAVVLNPTNIAFYWSPDGIIQYQYQTPPGQYSYLAGTWRHFVITRKDNRHLGIYVDGVQVGYDSVVTAFFNCGEPLRIGYDYTGSDWFNGLMDDFCLAEKLMYDANPNDTELLLNFEGVEGDTTTTDAGFNGHVPTFTGQSIIAARQSVICQLSERVNGYRFNGVDGGLEIADSPDWVFGLNDLTIDFWVKLLTNASGQLTFLSQIDSVNPFGYPYWLFRRNNASGNLYFGFADGVGVGGAYVTSAGIPALVDNEGSWHHVAAVRASGQVPKFYVDGVEVVGAIFGSWSNPMPDVPEPLDVGYRTATSAHYLNGYMQNVRISNVVRWTSTFTPPNCPLIVDDNTLLLLRGNGDLLDSGIHMHDVKSIGAINAWGGRFGGTALALSGAYSALNIPDSSDWDVCASSTDFRSIDFWVRHTHTEGTQMYVIQQQSASDFWAFFMNGDEGLKFIIRVGGVDYIVNRTKGYMIEDTDWHHVAMIKHALNYAIYLDGKQVYFDTATGTQNVTADLRIGDRYAIGSLVMQGVMDEIRFSKTPSDYDRFGANPQEYSVVLNFDGQEGATWVRDEGTTLHDVTFNGSTQIATEDSCKFRNGALRLNGTTQYVTAPDSDDWYFGTGDFTIDCWVKFNDLPGSGNYAPIVSQWIDSNNEWRLWRQDYGGIGYHWIVGGVVKGSGYTLFPAALADIDTWFHVAFVRDGTTARIFVDGKALSITVTTPFGSNDLGNLAAPLNIGRANMSGWRYVNGRIDELRISKGIARWTSDFDPCAQPYGQWLTEPHIVDDYTVLMARFDGSFIDSSWRGHTLTPANNPAIDVAPPYEEASSFPWKQNGAKWDGALWMRRTGTYVSLPNSADFDFGSGAFTIDMWLYYTDGEANDHSTVYCQRNAIDGNTVVDLAAGGNPAGYPYYDIEVGGGLIIRLNSIIKMARDRWNHLAVVRSGDTVYLFVNGRIGASGSLPGGYVMPTFSTAVEIGRNCKTVGPRWWNGGIAQWRVLKGTARWTSNFDPVTTGEPFDPVWTRKATTADGATVLLPMDGNAKDIIDTTRVPTYVGDPMFKYVNPLPGCLICNKVGSYVVMPTSSDWALSNADFTIDFWANFASQPPFNSSHGLCGTWESTGGNKSYRFTYESLAGVYGFRFDYSTTGVNEINLLSASNAGWTAELGRWYHIVLVRSGSVMGVYVDGVQVGYSAMTATIFHSVEKFAVGADGDSGDYKMHGSIAAFRMCKFNLFNVTPKSSLQSGFQVPTTAPSADSFEVPTGPATPDKFDLPTRAIDFTMPATGLVDELRALEFDGATEYLKCNDLAEEIQWDRQGSIAIWVKTDAYGVSQGIWDFGDNVGAGTGVPQIRLLLNASNVVNVDCFGGGIAQWRSYYIHESLEVGRWYHLVVTQDGFRPKLYINGKNTALDIYNTTGNIGAWIGEVASTGPMTGTIGALQNNGSPYSAFLNGMVADFRYYRYPLTAEEVDALWNDGVGTLESVPTVETVTIVTDTSYKTSPGIHPEFDPCLLYTTQTWNNGNDGMFIGTDFANDHRFLIRPEVLQDKDRIPKTASLVGSILHLIRPDTPNTTPHNGLNNDEMYMYRVLRHWRPVGTGPSDSAAYWAQYAPGHNWSVAGCNGAGTDRSVEMVTRTGPILNHSEPARHMDLAMSDVQNKVFENVVQRVYADNDGILGFNSVEQPTVLHQSNFQSFYHTQAERPYFEFVYKPNTPRVGLVRTKVGGH